MEVFRGWYRKSIARKDSVWHRVRCDHAGGSRFSIKGKLMNTVCERHIPITSFDFALNPDHRCLQCENSTWLVWPTGRVPEITKPKSKLTNAYVIRELRRLLKPRTYYIRIWDIYGVCITAKWESDVSIDIQTTPGIIIRRHKNKVVELSQVQQDLRRFKSEIDCLIEEADVLALQAKQKKGLKGKLTESESQEYFEELLYEAEK